MKAETETQSLTARLKNLDACDEAIEWASSYRTDAQRAWDECERGEWMLWAAGRTVNCPPWSDGRKPLLACALEVAETVKHLWPTESTEKIAAAIQVLRDWIGGTATKEQAIAAKTEIFAANAADAAAYAAYAAYATDAAYAAYAAANAADAAYAAYAAYAAAKKESSLESARIVRRHFPRPPQENKESK